MAAASVRFGFINSLPAGVVGFPGRENAPGKRENLARPGSFYGPEGSFLYHFRAYRWGNRKSYPGSDWVFRSIYCLCAPRDRETRAENNVSAALQIESSGAT
jgi:hypothetical protein